MMLNMGTYKNLQLESKVYFKLLEAEREAIGNEEKV